MKKPNNLLEDLDIETNQQMCTSNDNQEAVMVIDEPKTVENDSYEEVGSSNDESDKGEHLI